MKSKFCARCGKKTENLFDGLCEDCFKETNELFYVPKTIRISVCKNCGKIKVKKWERKSIDEAIKSFIKVDGKLKKLNIKKNQVGNKIFVEIKVFGLVKNKVEKTETKNTTVIIEKKLCDVCGKIRGGYYEAVIQLRSDDEEKIKKYLMSVKNIVEKNNGALTKVEKNKNGVDLYITPKNLVDKIIRNVPHTEVKKSYTLVTKKDGKNLYRMTALLRV